MLTENTIKESVAINKIVGSYGKNSPTIIVLGTRGIGVDTPVLTLVKDDAHYSNSLKNFNNALITVTNGHYKAFAGRDKSVNNNSNITFNNNYKIQLVKTTQEFGNTEFDVTDNNLKIVVDTYMPIFIMIFKVS